MKGRPGLVFGYNAQAVVDDESDLIVAAEVFGDETDNRLLMPMIEEARENTGEVAEETLADSGYDSGAELAKAEEAEVGVLVNLQSPSAQGPYSKESFVYDESSDEFICPQNRRLPLLGVFSPTTGKNYHVGHYRCSPDGCPVRKACTDCVLGRTIKRTEYEPARQRQATKQQSPAKRMLMSFRKEMIERVFGQIKGNQGFRRFLSKTLDGVRAQWALACLAANIHKLHPMWVEGRLQLAG